MTTTLPAALDVANASWVTEWLLVGGDLDVHDTELALRQLVELVRAGVTHIVDARLERNDGDFVTGLDAQMQYLWHGMDDRGQRVPGAWFDKGVEFALDALAEPDAIVLTHCHMGINRGPSLGYAVLLALGWDCVEALDAVRRARPIAYAAYAEDALRWHHDCTEAGPEERAADRERVRAWRAANPDDLVRVIAEQREAGR